MQILWTRVIPDPCQQLDYTSFEVEESCNSTEDNSIYNRRINRLKNFCHSLFTTYIDNIVELTASTQQSTGPIHKFRSKPRRKRQALLATLAITSILSNLVHFSQSRYDFVHQKHVDSQITEMTDNIIRLSNIADLNNAKTNILQTKLCRESARFNYRLYKNEIMDIIRDHLNRIDMDIARQLKHEIPDNSLFMINLISICKSINLNSETFCRSLISANKIIISH